MSAPVINTTTSILGYKQWEAWVYQPYATNSPTSWACPNLPAGLTVNSDTGKISGAAEVAGVFVCGLTATNGDGDSAPLVLTIGIEASNAALTSSGYEVKIDVATRQISFLAAGAASSQTVEETKISGATTTKTSGISTVSASAPNLFAKEGDSLLLWVTFVKNGQALDLDIQTLALAIKEFEPDNRLVLGETWKKYGSGTGAYYGLYSAIAGADLKSVLSNYESDSGTAFDGLAEIEWQEANADHGSGFGPENFRFTTRDFRVSIARDMAEES